MPAEPLMSPNFSHTLERLLAGHGATRKMLPLLVHTAPASLLNSPEPSLGCLYSSSLLGFLPFSPIAQPTAVSTVCMVHGRRTSSKTLAAAGMPPPESERRPVMFRLWHLYLPSVRCRV